MTKLIKDIQQRKLQANFTLNIDEKILNKIMENRTQLCVRACVCVYQDQITASQKFKNGLTLENQLI